MLGPGKAFVFELRVVSEIYQEAEIETGGVQIVQKLGAMLVS